MIQLYSLFDKKTSAYERPFLVSYVQEAIQGVQQALDEGKAFFARYPADYALYLVGHFDPTTGQMMPPSQSGPQFVIEVASLSRKPVNNEVKK